MVSTTMKPVTDPALLAQLESQSGGVPAPVAGPKPVTDPALLAQLEGGKPGLSAKGQAYRVGGGGAEAPAWYEELGGGLKHSLDKSALGLEKSVKWAANKIPGVNWEVDPENVENVQRGREFVKGTGALSTVGEVGGDILQGVAAGGPASLVKGGAGLVGKALPAAVDIASQAGWGALTAPENKGEAAALGGAGAAVGRALPHAVNLGRKVGGKALDVVVPSRMATEKIARHLGPEEFAQTGEAVRKGVAAGDSLLPQTTAAMADSPKLAGLERGMRGRGLVDMTGHQALDEGARAAQLNAILDSAQLPSGKVSSKRAQEAIDALRSKFIGSRGAPMSEITQSNLDKAIEHELAKSSKAKVPYLDQNMVEDLEKLSNELRKSDLYKTTVAPSDVKQGPIEKLGPTIKTAASLALGYGTSGMSILGQGAYTGLGYMAKKAVDKAVADPEAFLKLYSAKQARGEALAAWEKKLAKALRPATIAGGVAGRELGEE